MALTPSIKMAPPAHKLLAVWDTALETFDSSAIESGSTLATTLELGQQLTLASGIGNIIVGSGTSTIADTMAIMAGKHMSLADISLICLICSSESCWRILQSTNAAHIHT
ncbi:uncharacterized protein LOC116804731 [Drosophila mojavensis]|uniref:uncharacterized protein LOC116804731 n=1 Tax=Drosophila mojavensis TaxID=7230 RepID=UPI001CD1459F|nr:uncharacterized protein LOC116804731 [Drosophila mojavensis]